MRRPPSTPSSPTRWCNRTGDDYRCSTALGKATAAPSQSTPVTTNGKRPTNAPQGVQRAEDHEGLAPAAARRVPRSDQARQRQCRVDEQEAHQVPQRYGRPLLCPPHNLDDAEHHDDPAQPLPEAKRCTCRCAGHSRVPSSDSGGRAPSPAPTAGGLRPSGPRPLCRRSMTPPAKGH